MPTLGEVVRWPVVVVEEEQIQLFLIHTGVVLHLLPPL